MMPASRPAYGGPAEGVSTSGAGTVELSASGPTRRRDPAWAACHAPPGRVGGGIRRRAGASRVRTGELRPRS
ncbi:hypothetical protein GCM10012279_09880 [Micromonospora yangpuensis]|nr:hypothetical protein GCM10012279_09880 [Micromonospora yangpuensis]